MKNLPKVLYKVSSVRPDRTTDMANMGNSLFWLDDISKISSETTWPSATKLCSKYLCEVFYKVSSFRPDRTTNMAATGNLVSDWLILKKCSTPNGKNCARTIYARSLTRFPHFVWIRQQIWLSWVIFVSDRLIVKKKIFFERSKPNETKLYRVHLRKVLYNVPSFGWDDKYCRHRQFLFLIGW